MLEAPALAIASAPHPVPGTATFRVRCLVDANAPLRVLALFAQQDLTPSRVVIRRAANWLLIYVRQDDIDEHRAEVIAAKMSALVLAVGVDHSFIERANAAGA